MFFPSRMVLAAALACCGAAAAQAQTQTVIVTGNPLGRSGDADAASSLSGPGLQLRRAASLGDTLDGLPGVAASGFGPNASRPVIRGLDGDRVRLLDNGGAVVDASSLSFDHAVALDPLVAERIDVLRGPAALLYGGNATGGVVNVIDNRIPRLAAAGLGGRAEVRLGGAARERAGVAVLEGGSEGGFNWHADALARRTDDQRAPLPGGRVQNSAARTEAGALGAGWAGAQGYAGVAVDTLRQRYGVTVEPDVTIRLDRDRLALGGEWRLGSGFVHSLSARAGHTRYQHEEVGASGEIGTTFRSRGDDARVELRHAPIGGVEGVWGLQAETLHFSALGEEAFVPSTRTHTAALFALQEWAVPKTGLVLSAGARAERARVASEGDADAAAPRFGDATERRFTPTSAAIGMRASLTQGWQINASLGSTQRAPAYYELYANGLHVATHAFETGDPMLGVERSRHAELGLAWRAGGHHVKLAVYGTRFSNYIALDATGANVIVDGEPVPAYRFQGVRARLSGAELEGRVRVLQGASTLDLTGTLDVVHGDNLSAGTPLPRLPPLRARLGVEWGERWHAGAELRHAARQTRVSANDTATPGFTMLDLWARGAISADRRMGWYAKLGNVSDEVGFNAAAVATIRPLAALPGRALAAGVSVRW